MTQSNQVTETLSALNAARADLGKARTEHASSSSALEIAQSNFKGDASAATRKALLQAETDMRFASLSEQGAAERFSAAQVAHAAHVESERKAELEARRADCSHDKFVAACANTAQKRAELRARLAEADADIERLVRGYASDAQACGAAAIDYSRLAESLTLRASGLNAASVLTRAWSAAPAQSMSAEETLALAEHGTSPALVNAKLAALRDAVRRQAVAGAKVAQGLFLGPKAAPSTTPLGQFETCALEVRSTRLELVALGFGKAADAVSSDPLSLRLQKAGPARVEGLLRNLRTVDATPIAGYWTAAELAEKRDALAAPIVAALVELGFESESQQVRPPAARATNPHTIKPVDGPGFAEVGLS